MLNEWKKEKSIPTNWSSLPIVEVKLLLITVRILLKNKIHTNCVNSNYKKDKN